MGGGTVQVHLFSGSVVVGTVRLKWWGGGPSSFFFLQFAVSSLGVRLSVVRLSSFILIFFLFGYILVVSVVSDFYELLIFSYLLQMVEEEYGPGGL